MSVLLEAIRENLQRNLYMQDVYKKNMNKLRKGKVRIKKINGKEYYYLVYRDGEKIRTDYIGIKDQTDLSAVEQELEDRKNYQKQIRQLKAEEKEIRKAIRALGGADNV